MTTLSMREVLVHVEKEHTDTERLLVRFRAVEADQQADVFFEFVGALARHELVEEVFVYPDHEEAPGEGHVALGAPPSPEADRDTVVPMPPRPVIYAMATPLDAECALAERS